MANSNGWGDGAANNNIGWGQGAINNSISWGKSHISSWSGATDIDGGNAPTNTVAPAITGTAQEGQTLTCSTGTWTGTPTYTYQWKRNGSNIGSATNSTYTLVTADVGQSIKCTVTATNGVGSANADSNTVIPISAFTGLLDSYPSASVAYSLRRLRTAYTGNAIRVRRSSDNTEQDFGFVNNVLDTASLLTFCGAGNGFVTAWYDQTGNGRNATNTTAANQPSIVASGVILVENSKPSLLFDGNTQRLGTLYTLTFPYSIFAIAKRLITGSSGLIGTQRIGNITAGGFVFFTEASVLKLRHPAAVDVTIADTANLFLGYAGRVSNTGYIGINNSALNSVSSLNATQYNQNVSIGGALTATSPFRLWNGYISEVIMYASDNSANRTGIETNINTYYSIY